MLRLISLLKDLQEQNKLKISDQDQAYQIKENKNLHEKFTIFEKQNPTLLKGIIFNKKKERKNFIEPKSY